LSINACGLRDTGVYLALLSIPPLFSLDLVGATVSPTFFLIIFMSTNGNFYTFIIFFTDINGVCESAQVISLQFYFQVTVAGYGPLHIYT